MARPIEYDLQVLLDRTTELFLANRGTTILMEDIVSETGFNRHSLYKLFGNKDELYNRVVENYRDRFLCHGYKILEDDSQGLFSIKKIFGALLSGKSPVRCLMVNTIAEYEKMNDGLKKLARIHFLRVEDAYEHNVKIGIRKGEVSKSHNAGEIASYLVMTMQGLPVNTRLYGNKKVKKLVFSYLDGLKG